VRALIAGRLALIGTAQNFYDSQTSKAANYYTAQLQYKLGACKQSTTPGSNTTDAGAPTKSATREARVETNPVESLTLPPGSSLMEVASSQLDATLATLMEQTRS
jgi:hypothetical protein